MRKVVYLFLVATIILAGLTGCSEEKKARSFLRSDPKTLDFIIVMARDVERDSKGQIIKEPSDIYYKLEDNDFSSFLQLLNESSDLGIQSNKRLSMHSMKSFIVYSSSRNKQEFHWVEIVFDFVEAEPGDKYTVIVRGKGEVKMKVGQGKNADRCYKFVKDKGRIVPREHIVDMIDKIKLSQNNEPEFKHWKF